MTLAEPNPPKRRLPTSTSRTSTPLDYTEERVRLLEAEVLQLRAQHDQMRAQQTQQSEMLLTLMKKARMEASQHRYERRMASATDDLFQTMDQELVLSDSMFRWSPLPKILSAPPSPPRNAPGPSTHQVPLSPQLLDEAEVTI